MGVHKGARGQIDGAQPRVPRYENAPIWSPGKESLEATILDERLFGSESWKH
jgi:hypothetical protein